MNNELFEKRLEQELMGLRIEPSAAVWQQVEVRIQKEKKRRAFLWWFFFGIVMAGVGIHNITPSPVSLQDAENSKMTEKEIMRGIMKSTEEQKESNEPEKNEAINPSIYRPTLIASNTRISDKDDVNKSGTINTSEEEVSGKIEELVSTATAESRINKAFINEQKIKTERKGLDTIIILRCQDIGKSNSIKENSSNRDQKLHFNAFYSIHGTGDLEGTKLEFGTEKRWGKRYGFYNNLGLTIHSGQEVSSVYPLNLNSTYKSLQTLTAGIQTTPTIYRYSKRGDLKLGAGLVARYQASSSSDYGATSMGAGTNQYSYRIYQSDPNSFSIGYCISAELLLFEKKKNQLGFQLFFQNDTRGDVITGFGLSFQTKYNK